MATTLVLLNVTSIQGASPPTRYDTVEQAHFTELLYDFRFDIKAKGRIVGTVKRKGEPENVPLKRRVRLYRDVDGMLIAETWSDDAGNFTFERVEENMAYTVLSHDHLHHNRAVAADNLTLANGGVEVAL